MKPAGPFSAVAAALAAALLLAGCMTAPMPKAPELPMPAQWRTPADTSALLADRSWSTAFADPRLDALIHEALAANSDLIVATQRVLLARAQYGIQRSYQYPTIGGELGYQAQQAPGADPNRNTSSNLTRLGLALPLWELDFWGRLQSLSDAARAQALATDQAWRQVYITLIADVAASYINLGGLDEALAIARRTAESRAKSLAIVVSRNRGGVSSKLDVRQAEILLTDARATIAALERQRAQAENALSVLVGRNPDSIARSDAPLSARLPAELPAGLPSQLLARRPDLAAAALRLVAAELDVDAARKAFLPAISLTGFLGFVSPELRQLVSGDRVAWSATPAISLPLFNAGRLRANVDLSAAQRRIAVEEYRQAARNALREVDDALVAYARLREQRGQLELSVRAGRERLRLTRRRYDNGISSYFEVLDAERQLFENELASAQSARAAYGSYVQVYRSLGGGWTDADVNKIAATP